MSRYQQQRLLRDQRRQQGFAQRIGIAEHLSDGFAASCTDICAQTNADPSLRSACDLGSQAYCSTADKIASVECNPYVDRLIRTRAAEKASTVYANAVVIPPAAKKTTADYYNALGDAANSYIASNITNLSSSSVTGLMNVVQAEGGDMAMFNKVADGAIAGCVQSSTECSSVPWIKSRVDKVIADQVLLLATASLGTILDYISTNLNHYIKFEDSYAPMRALILSKMTIADITNPVLIAIRERSSTLRTAIDLRVINYVCNGSLTAIPTNTAGDYMVDLSAQPNLYAGTLNTFVFTLASRKPFADSDKLLMVCAEANRRNGARCATVDPLTDPTCKAIRDTGRPEFVSAMDAALANYCANPATVTGDSCVGYVNGLTDPVRKSRALATAYTAAVKTDGSIDDTVLNKYGSAVKNWLKAKTEDVVTTDAAGNTVITPSCGTANSLPVDQCKQICKLYPDVCLDDTIRKAQLPQYRYAKESFVGGNLGHVTICSPDELSAQTLLFLILLAIAFAFVFIYCRRRVMQRTRQRPQAATTEPVL